MNTNPTPSTPKRGQPGPTARLGVSVLAALLTLAAVFAHANDELAGLFEQVVMKAQIVAKAAPAEKQDAAKTKTKTGKKTIVAKAKKTVVAKKIVVNGNPNVNPMIQQFVQQGKPMMHAELLFARNLCKLDKPTLVKMYPETTKVLDEVATKLANGQMQVRKAGAKNPDAATLLQQGLAAVFKKHLTADQYRIYETETARRLEARKKAAARFMVDAIDREVLLSADQRTKINQAIEKNWDESWVMYVEYLLYGNQFFPTDVDKHVTPELNDAQKKVWQTTQKTTGFWGFGGIWMFNGQQDPVAGLLGLEEVKKDEPAVGKAAMKAKAAVKAEKKAEKKAEAKPVAKK